MALFCSRSGAGCQHCRPYPTARFYHLINLHQFLNGWSLGSLTDDGPKKRSSNGTAGAGTARANTGSAFNYFDEGPARDPQVASPSDHCRARSRHRSSRRSPTRRCDGLQRHEAEIASFLHSDILALVKRAPSAGLAFWRHTLIDGAIFRQAITSNGRRSAIARVAHLFCEQFTRARAVGSISGWSCPFPLTQSQIGQVVGLSLPTVNRATQSLRKEHCAEVRSGSLRIFNWRRLSQQAGFDPIYLHADVSERN
jgi:hypothetical protein